MVRITIDGQLAQVPAGTTIMEAAKAVNVKIPHLCYLKGINEISACRICCVEVEGERAMVAACSNPVKDGMVVYTNSPRARMTRRTNVELILSQHDCKCATCVRAATVSCRRLRMIWVSLSFPLKHSCRRGCAVRGQKHFPFIGM